MTGLNHVTRRGAIYVWCRYLPARISRTDYLQISLRTSTFSIAKILANLVSSGFEASILDMERKRITRAEAQRFLAGMVARELERIEVERYFEPDAPSPDDWRNRYIKERCRAQAARLVASQGQAAALLKDDRVELARNGFSKMDLECVAREVEELKASLSSDTFQQETKELAAALGLSDCAGLDMRAVSSFRLVAEAEALERNNRRKPLSVFPDLDLTCSDEVPHRGSVGGDARGKTSEEETANSQGRERRYSDQMQNLIADYVASGDKSAEDPAEQRKIDKGVKQRWAVLTQFSEVVGLPKITELRQDGFLYYVSVLERIPKIYRKSAEDRRRSLAEILDRSEELSEGQVCLSANTINRNITFVKGFLDHADDKGVRPAEEIRLSQLRKVKDEDEREARLVFSEDIVASIAAHLTCMGCRCDSQRHKAGRVIIKDSLYWAPIIASVTGAHREEILGMGVQDVMFDHDIPFFHFRKNKNRRLKNAASERFVPIHSKSNGAGVSKLCL